MLSYATEMRRQLHMYPEVGFDLPLTVALVKNELNKMNIPYTEKYGKSSVVATLNQEKSHFTIGIRADMDALPILEKTKVAYKSKIKGQMHACGHDAHTAILLDTARKLSLIKDEIDCCVKFIFQSAEEVAPSGAKLMAEDGVMDDIDCAVALHCEVNYPVGKVHFLKGPQNAISSGFQLDFYGKSAHAGRQEDGVDAIGMGVKAYNAIELMIAKEISPFATRIFNVGTFNGGFANNIICDHASMYCSLRTWDEATDSKITKRIKQIISSIAKESGGKAKYTQLKYYPIVYNNDIVTQQMMKSAEKIVGKDNIGAHLRSMGGEDFAYFARLKPSCMFRLGVRNEEKDCIYTAHQDKFNIDEDALDIGSEIFVRFVKDNMKGIAGI